MAGKYVTTVTGMSGGQAINSNIVGIGNIYGQSNKEVPKRECLRTDFSDTANTSSILVKYHFHETSGLLIVSDRAKASGLAFITHVKYVFN